MKVNELESKLNLKLLTKGDMDAQCTGCYSGDLLSWVMSKAQAGDIWLTVMGNINSVAVSVLCDCACIILTENAALDDDARLKAEIQGVTIFSSEKNAYELSVEIGKLI
ncbi:MAG: AraC family transcriptional regulator [Acutalibacteraceae bacterium]|nr:AraC family transcriptional regulator [Acutalibacteraceae bacterium]